MEGHDRADGEKMGGRDKWCDRTEEIARGKRSWERTFCHIPCG